MLWNLNSLPPPLQTAVELQGRHRQPRGHRPQRQRPSRARLPEPAVHREREPRRRRAHLEVSRRSREQRLMRRRMEDHRKPRKTPLFLIVSCLRPFYHKFSVFLNICQFLAFIRSTFFSLTSLCWLLFYSMRSTPLSSPRLPLYVNNTVVYSKLFFSSVPSFVSPLQLYLWISFISTAASWGRRSRRPTNSLSVITRFDYFK